MEYEKVMQKIIGLQSDFSRFKVEFIDRDDFKEFADKLYDNLYDWTEICITGYFSETIRKDLEKIIRIPRRVRLICPEFRIESTRDRRNLQALTKLAEAGAEIKVNSRLHARFLVAHHPKQAEIRGLLLLGSFDFNTECIGKERYDAGIKTWHPDLVQSAMQLFEHIWNEPESLPLHERYHEKIRLYR